MPTKHEGLSYKFPFDAEKKTYQFFDTTAQAATTMKYKGSEKIQGLTVYRYQQQVGPVQIGELEVPGDLVGSSAPSVKAPRWYDNIRTVWVEPLSGVIVKGQEQQHQALKDAAGADAVTLIKVTVTFDERTQKQQADLAKDARSKAALVGTWVPLAAIVLAIICGVLAFVLGRREDDDGGYPGTPSRHPPPSADRSPAYPRRSSRPAASAAGLTPCGRRSTRSSASGRRAARRSASSRAALSPG